ncbi:hypothetical protein [Ruminobacter sp.]|uniref:hypothetical protein n=1 Tax=Ruminobacter sp. TaxID=2774296 RepID=UPI00386352A1
MSFKKSVTFTASVSDFEDGIVSARVQAENKILDDFVSWILAQNSSIQRLEKISIGDNEWSGQPMHAVEDEGLSSVITYYCSSFSQLSDIHVLGKDKDNFCLGICVDNHTLSMAPTCSFAYQRYLNGQVNRPLSIVMAQLRSHNRANNRVTVGGSQSLFTFSHTEETLTLRLNYWKGDDTLVFGVFGESARVFFSSDMVDASWGFSRKNGMLMNFSFNETIQASVETQNLTASTSTGREHNVSLGYATNLNPFFWGNMNSATSGWTPYYYNSSYLPVPILSHHMNLKYFNESPTPNDFSDDFVKSSPSFVVTGNILNLPRISGNQLYLRKQYLPNRLTASPVRLGYTPGFLTADMIYTVNDRNYLCLQYGWLSFFIEVKDQG